MSVSGPAPSVASGGPTLTWNGLNAAVEPPHAVRLVEVTRGFAGGLQQIAVRVAVEQHQ